MSRTAKPWIPAIVAIASVGLYWVWPPLAVGFTFVFWFAATMIAFGFNVPLTRLAAYLALAAHVTSVYLGSRSVLLTLAVLCAGLVWRQSDRTTLRLFGNNMRASMAIPLALFVASIVLFAAAWSSAGQWWWAGVPAVVVLGLMYGGLIVPKYPGILADYAKFREGVKLGETLPDFTLPHRSGDREFRLSDHRGQFVILSFLRGDWCPVCQVLMRTYRVEAPRLAEHNVHLAVISPSGGEESEAFAREIGVNYDLLVDEDSEVAKQLGSMHSYEYADKLVQLPVALLIDPEGVLRFVSKPDDLSFFDTGSEVVKLLEASRSRATA